ncbi:MAG: isoamylase [Brevinematales bacterium]|nr:isoamylase [Brevinematales bacterium]
MKRLFFWLFIGWISVVMGCAVSSGNGGGTSGGNGGSGGGSSDTTPPEVRLLSPTNGETFLGAGVHAMGEVRDNGGISEVKLYLTTNQAAFTNIYTATVSATNFFVSNVLLDKGNGAYLLWVTAVDTSGNKTSTTPITIVLNATVVVNTHLPTPMHITNLSTFVLTGTAGATSESVTAVYVSVNGGAYTLATGTTSWSLSVSLLPHMTNTLSVYARTPSYTSSTNTYTVIHQGFLPVDEATWATATWGPGGRFSSSDEATFAVYSKNATKIVLEIYRTPYGEDALYRYEMAKGSDHYWRAKLKYVTNGTVYAFRVWGPNWPYVSSWQPGTTNGFLCDVDSAGNRFNPNKVLYDPWALEITHDRNNPLALASAGVDGNVYGTGPYVYSGKPRRQWDTGKVAPKSYLIKDTTSYGTKPALSQKDAIIYEAHVRGMTIHPSSVNLATILSGFTGFESVAGVPDQYRGTYKGAAYMAKYLKALGYTTIELLPVHETDNDHNPTNQSGGNYWGYMTYGYFAPDRRYAYDKSPGGPTREFKEMVKAFHDEGLEVYLDVVYNHTGEGGLWGDTNTAELTCFRGFDNSEFYALVAGSPQYYWESTGCGNNFNTTKQVVRDLITNSLAYWADEMGIDGFRFDLAPVLGRDSAPTYAFNPSAQLLLDIVALGTSRNIEMIAEAWDISTYQVGNFPTGWGEWNGRYRDQVRRFLKGDGNTTGPDTDPKFVQVFNGDWGYFNNNGGPHKSVNFIVAHDGFTLMDLVSYNAKQNSTLTWPFGPSDGGSDNNDSWDSALYGSAFSNQMLRRQRLRNFWVVQMFSRGVPMTVYGDEFGRTQNGNNNPYNIDSVATWNNYTMINTDSPHLVSTGGGGSYHNNYGTDSTASGLAGKNDLFLFVKKLIALRKAHPVLRQDTYSVSYDFRKEDGVTSLSDGNRCVWVRIDGSSIGDSDFLVFINMWTSLVTYTVPSAESGKKWVRIIDTAWWAEDNNNIWDVSTASTITTSYGVNPWSIVVLQEVPL